MPEGNNGCNGGNMYNSYMYVIFNDGVNTEKSYPFEGIVCNKKYAPNLFTLVAIYEYCSKRHATLLMITLEQQ